MKFLKTSTKYYIARKVVKDEVETVEPIYYESYGRTYSPASDYEYATPYATQQEVEKRVTILNMLAQLETLESVETKYITVKKSETIEEVISEI